MYAPTLVPVSELDESSIVSAYYGKPYVYAWTRRHPRPFPYPYVLGQTIDGIDCIDEDEAFAHIEYLWDVVYHFRSTFEVPAWWSWLIDHRDEHHVYGLMLDHLEDIAERQMSYEESGEWEVAVTI